jgi:hypothetical protein
MPSFLRWGMVMGTYIDVAEIVFQGVAAQVAADKSNKLGPAITQAVKEVTSADSPEQAETKVRADSLLADRLKTRVGQIVSNMAEVANGAAKPGKPADDDARAQADTDHARDALLALAKADPILAWTPSIISYLIVLGFFAVIAFLVSGLFRTPTGDSGPAVIQIVNICIGALTAAFATVVNFWLGSSLGSRGKDAQAKIEALAPDRRK